MTRPGRRRGRGRALLLATPALAASLALTAPAVAQDTTAVPRDTVGTDSIAIAQPALLPTLQPAVPFGPLPPGTRVTFTPDSILWVSGVTLADLLASIPGVYVARAGFLGQPEYVAYAGRGGASLELYWDGVPLPPLSGDSLFHDPGRIYLSHLERVDVQVLPSTLRVYLVSARHDALAPRSVIRLLAGDFDTAAYGALFQKRWASGIGLNLAADFVGTDGASGPNRNDQSFNVWARLDWLPSARRGASYQVRRQSHERDPVERDPVGTLPGVPGRDGVRTDVLFTLFAQTRDDDLGLRAEGGLAASSWTADSVVPDQRVRQAHLRLRYARPSWTAEFTGRLGDARVSSGVQGRLGWVPLRGVVLAGDARWRSHEGERSSFEAHGTLGLYRGPFSLVGSVELSDAVQAPSLLTDSAQRTVDRSIRAGLATERVAGHVAIVRRDAFLPLPYPDLAVIAGLDSSAAATYIVADLRLASSRALELEAWYSTPVNGTAAADLQPPKHGRAQVTFRSKFWRTFRSGAFDFKVQIAMEFWSRGSAGFDVSGTPIGLKGATFYEAFIQFQIVGFAAFWNLRNAYNSPDPYVPGLNYPKAVQTFGVKWEFMN